ncbi:hypothetical protein BKA67DRAFT_253170 [Truncatella angustata]|uniref:Uncharacterized protein n=1 Tax=Truncatella angustata TaxID=152316 RepID=A0A9P8ZYF5_9PEZI|nr:uncharacterized protein BKA67DRAFT_253170 [Truncatella angustata]KAH6655986.1 hypothetical protein BKA67DRAFT_253170 [Truncatella angustata]
MLLRALLAPQCPGVPPISLFTLGWGLARQLQVLLFCDHHPLLPEHAYRGRFLTWGESYWSSWSQRLVVSACPSLRSMTVYVGGLSAGW